MKKPHLWENSGVITLVILVASCLSTQPSYAEQLSNTEQSSPETNLTEQIPQEQEQQTPDIPHVEGSLEQEFCDTTPEDMTLAIPLGTKEPFTDIKLQNDDSETSNSRNYEAVGYFTKSGEPQPITAKDMCQMFETSRNFGGSFDINFHYKAKTILLSLHPIDISPLIQAKRISVIDLIVRDKDDGKYYLLPNITVDSFCRDALNSVHNGTFRQYDGNEIKLQENNNDWPVLSI
ncbi:MAG: hypothetical protein F6K21_06950 [Symploca sp. SIO2D2]|nr:hypothetical protein [Symploca sp. SIO2D2]